jgi:hypothetical protein
VTTCHSQGDGSLTVHDHGSHLTARLLWHGPLDDANMEEALAWVRQKLRGLSKPIVLATATGEVLLLPDGGQLRVERLLKRS